MSEEIKEETLEEKLEPVTQQEDQQDVKVEEPRQETAADRNWRALEESKKKAERERDELLRKLKDHESRNSRQTIEEDDDISIDPDDFVEGKHISKVSAKIKKLEERLVKQNEEARLISVESQLKSKYPDFDKVVSKDNIDILKSLYPEIAQTIQNNNDIYSKAVSAYTLIKKFDIDNRENYDNEKSIVESNHAKPRPINSISKQSGSSPLHKANAFANGLTEDLKKQLYKEMLEARKNY